MQEITVNSTDVLIRHKGKIFRLSKILDDGISSGMTTEAITELINEIAGEMIDHEADTVVKEISRIDGEINKINQRFTDDGR